MELIETGLKDCYIIKMKKFGDDRGFFLESFNQRKLKEAGIDFEIKQINFARSQKDVFRGLHYQLDPHAQAKLVGVITGAVLDVVVDLRKSSPTYLQHEKIELADPDTLLLVPRGFGHGYLSLVDNTTFHYAVDNFYAPKAERSIRYDDPELGIELPIKSPLISEKDKAGNYVSEFESTFS